MMEFQAVILAAGRGSRMTDLTSATPKALLPIANKPMISYPIHMLEKVGFEEAIVVVQEPDLAIIQKELVEVCGVYLKLDFVAIPQGEDWGTADTLRHIKDKFTTNDILVLSCDLITDVSLHHLADLHRTYDATVTMLLAPAPDTSDMASPGGKASKKMERDIVGLKENGPRVLFLSSEADFEESIPFKKSLTLKVDLKFRKMFLAERDIVGLKENGPRVLFLSSEADFEESIPFKKSFFKKHPNVTMKTRLFDGHLYCLKRWVLDLLDKDKSISTIKGELVPILVRRQFTSPKEVDTSRTQVDDATDNDRAENDLEKLAQSMSTWIDHRGDMADCFHGDEVRCYAHVVNNGFVLRANTIVTYCEANRQVPKQLSALLGQEPGPQLVHPAASIQQRAQVGSDSMVGDGTTVAEKVGIKRSIIGRHCTIGEKVKVTNSILLDHVTIQEGSSLTGCIVCSNAHIAEKCELKDCLIGANQNIVPMGKYTNEIIVELDRMEI